MKVSTGSKEQDLIGYDITILRTFSCEHDRKDVNDDFAPLMIGGCERPPVSKRTRSILQAEKTASPSAVRPVAHHGYVQAKATSSSRSSLKIGHRF